MGRRDKRRRPAELTFDGRRSNFTLGSHETMVSWGDGDEVTIVRQSDILAIVE
jgi:co-chaperonin GroES (HSP10)